MPLFEIGENELVPFRRVKQNEEVYEEAIEDLLWENLEEFIGVPLFPLRRQLDIANKLVPDVVALDGDGRVYVIEVKRHIARQQLAQCLEYAGWAMSTSLDELASKYKDGKEAFFGDWTEFTESDSPQLIIGSPQLVLIAHDFDSRTQGALDFLAKNNLPVTVIRMTIYEDQQGRRFIDIDSEHEIEFDRGKLGRGKRQQTTIQGRRVALLDLVEAELVSAETILTWTRPRKKVEYKATVTADGKLRLDDGSEYSAPSPAAKAAAGVNAVAGWNRWKLEDGRSLADVRGEYIAKYNEATSSDPEDN